MNLNYVGYIIIDRGKVCPQHGPLADAEVLGHTIMTIYDADECKPDIKRFEWGQSCWIIQKSDKKIKHNPHGPAEMAWHHKAKPNGNPWCVIYRYKNFFLYGSRVDKATGFMFVENGQWELYVALGFRIIGSYAVRTERDVDNNVSRKEPTRNVVSSRYRSAS